MKIAKWNVLKGNHSTGWADIISYLLFTLSGNYTRLVLQFELRRNVLYFILETYVPSTFLVVLSWVSFWISLDSVPARTCIGKQLPQEISKNWCNRSFFVFLPPIRLFFFFPLTFTGQFQKLVSWKILLQKEKDRQRDRDRGTAFLNMFYSDKGELWLGRSIASYLTYWTPPSNGKTEDATFRRPYHSFPFKMDTSTLL